MAEQNGEKKHRGKFTKEQKEFLLSKVAEFREAQQSMTTRAYFPALYIEWFARWPLEDDGDQADGEASSLDDCNEDSVLTPRQEVMKVRISTPIPIPLH